MKKKLYKCYSKGKITEQSLSINSTKPVQEVIVFSQFICKLEAKYKAHKKL